MSSPFLRLFWKEYRAQRSLWLVLTFCLVLLQVVVVCVDDRSNLAELIFGFAVVITCCFVVASVALLFAGEEDLGTAIWLRQIPVSTKCLFWSKVSAALTGTLAMTAVAACSTLIILAVRHWKLELSPRDIGPFALFSGTLFLVSLFWSLRCRSVFRSLGFSGATIVGAAIIFQGFSTYQVESAFAIVFVVLLVLLPLPRRWHRGLRIRGTRRSRTKLASMFSRLLQRARPVTVFLGIVAGALWAVALVRMFSTPNPMWTMVMMLIPVLAFGLSVALFLLGRLPNWATWLQQAASAPHRTEADMFRTAVARMSVCHSLWVTGSRFGNCGCGRAGQLHAGYSLVAAAADRSCPGMWTQNISPRSTEAARTVLESSRGFSVTGLGNSQCCLVGCVAGCESHGAVH